jgi:hypothetical protein
MNLAGYTDEEIQRWLHLRAIEWSGFPSFLSQIIVPILFIFYPWWLVVLGVVLVGLAWCVVRYWFISATILDTACLAVVWLKCPLKKNRRAAHFYARLRRPTAQRFAIIGRRVCA